MTEYWHWDVREKVIDCNLVRKNTTRERQFIDRIRAYVISLPVKVSKELHAEGIDFNCGKEQGYVNIRKDLKALFTEFGF